MEDNKNSNINQETNPSGAQTVSIDYDKIAKIVEGKQAAAEESVLKGYFKQQGMTGEEMSEAIKMFKADKAAKTPDVNALNAQIEEANKRAVKAEVNSKALSLSAELGVEINKMPYLIKMADMGEVISDGQVDGEKLKEALNAVLKELPELKQSKEEADGNANGGFRIGADHQETKENSNAELARIFGVKMKG